jgi:hypothetical protein
MKEHTRGPGYLCMRTSIVRRGVMTLALGQCKSWRPYKFWEPALSLLLLVIGVCLMASHISRFIFITPSSFDVLHIHQDGLSYLFPLMGCFSVCTASLVLVYIGVLSCPRTASRVSLSHTQSTTFSSTSWLGASHI